MVEQKPYFRDVKQFHQKFKRINEKYVRNTRHVRRWFNNIYIKTDKICVYFPTRRNNRIETIFCVFSYIDAIYAQNNWIILYKRVNLRVKIYRKLTQFIKLHNRDADFLGLVALLYAVGWAGSVYRVALAISGAFAMCVNILYYYYFFVV